MLILALYFTKADIHHTLILMDFMHNDKQVLVKYTVCEK